MTIHIAFLVFDGVQTLDFTGPYEVFAKANQLSASPVYEVHKIGYPTERVTTGSGVGLLMDVCLSKVNQTFDTIVLPGGLDASIDTLCEDQRLTQWIHAQSKLARRMVSVCNGTFLLAAANLLSKRSVTTHWQSCARLKQRFPDIKVNENDIYVKDGSIYTSAGITSGIDLALALVEEDCGRQVALSIAQELVLHLKRPANQAQLSSVLQAQFLVKNKLKEVLDWALANPAEDLSVEALAQRAAMSTRSFSRNFKQETGTTPAKVIEVNRIQYAKSLLLETNLPLKKISLLSGFGSEETMRRVFVKATKIPPSEYRSSFK